MVRLKKFKERPASWDKLIKGYDSKTLFHESVWHDHILSIHKNSEMLYYAIHDKESIVGYFCGLVVRKFTFKIMGSPLSGTGTNYMGPVVNFNIDQVKVIAAIEAVRQQENIDFLELCNDVFQCDILQKNGYQLINSKTHKVKIATNEKEAFNTLKSTCRNRIRKGKKYNLQVEITNDPSIIDLFFEQYEEVYGKQGKSTPFRIKRVRSLYNHLYFSNRLLPVWVKKGETVIATGLFPYDEHTIYFWGAASWLKYQKFCPNELLHWEVIRFAVKNGIKRYNMCGGGSQFKNKFGGSDVSHTKFFKSSSRSIDLLKTIYKKWHFLWLSLNKIHF